MIHLGQVLAVDPEPGEAVLEETVGAAGGCTCGAGSTAGAGGG